MKYYLASGGGVSGSILHCRSVRGRVRRSLLHCRSVGGARPRAREKDFLRTYGSDRRWSGSPQNRIANANTHRGRILASLR